MSVLESLIKKSQGKSYSEFIEGLSKEEILKYDEQAKELMLKEEKEFVEKTEIKQPVLIGSMNRKEFEDRMILEDWTNYEHFVEGLTDGEIKDSIKFIVYDHYDVEKCFPTEELVKDLNVPNELIPDIMFYIKKDGFWKAVVYRKNAKITKSFVQTSFAHCKQISISLKSSKIKAVVVINEHMLKEYFMKKLHEKPDYYQKEALISMETKNFRKGKIVMPCGSGKSFIISYFTEKKHLENNILIIVHNDILVKQMTGFLVKLGIKDCNITNGLGISNNKIRIIKSTFIKKLVPGKPFLKINGDPWVTDYVLIDDSHKYENFDGIEYKKKMILFTSERQIGTDILFNYGYNRAINEGFISQINLMTIPCSEKLDTNSRFAYMLEEIQKLIKKRTIEKVLIFVKSFNSSNFKKEIDKYSNIHIIESSNKNDHIKIIKQIEDKDNFIIISTNIIGTGVDIPSVDSVYLSYDMMHKKRININLEIQRDRIGRGSRYKHNKYNNIICPLIKKSNYLINIKTILADMSIVAQLINETDPYFRKLFKEYCDSFEINIV